jgi:DNA mismatch repair protein MutS
MEATTPMLRQYLEIKDKHPGTILFFRLGDFYEMFFEDAVLASRELDITLTARQKESPNPVPMCGVPHHSASGYIAKLVRKGHRVAICEQAEEAGKGTKLVRREVVRIITPGTAVDAQALNSGESVYLASVYALGESVGAAFLELSTGEFHACVEQGERALENVRAVVESFSPRELIHPESLSPVVGQVFGGASPGGGESDGISLRSLPDSDFQTDRCRDFLLSHLGVRELTAYGIDDMPTAISAAGSCLAYATANQRSGAAHVVAISLLRRSDHLVLDEITLRNLEIVAARGESKGRSLLSVIDRSVTAMGGRLLRSWLVRPSVRPHEISARHDGVESLGDAVTRNTLRTLLERVYDLERLVGRLNLGTASARDLIALAKSLEQVPSMKGSLPASRPALVQVIDNNLHPLEGSVALIAASIADEPPINLADGGTIRDGFDPELDELRSVSRDAKGVIAAFEDSERDRTGISSLKVRFNNVFGYYIEVSKTNLAKVPEDYVRKQTLANAERFTTPELKEWEQKVLSADERMVRLETDIFNRVREEIRGETTRLIATARAIAMLDTLATLAETAALSNYVRPVLHDGDELTIKDGRHPVVEAFVGQSFVPNDIFLNNTTDRLLVIRSEEHTSELQSHCV